MPILIVPNEVKIAGMTAQPAGLVRRWHRLLMREMSVSARIITRMSTKTGTGELARSFSVKYDSASISRSSYKLSNSAPYARFVFLGTRGPITAGGRTMPVGKSSMIEAMGRVPNPTASGIRFRRKVRGQKANNIPMRAFRVTLGRRGMLGAAGAGRG